MATINILALNEGEIKLIEEVLIFAEKKGKDINKKAIASSLLDKIQLKFYYSPEEIGKLKGLTPKAKRFYFYFFEKFDFDIIEYIKKIAKPLDSIDMVLSNLLISFPPIYEILEFYNLELRELVTFVTSI